VPLVASLMQVGVTHAAEEEFPSRRRWAGLAANDRERGERGGGGLCRVGFGAGRYSCPNYSTGFFLHQPGGTKTAAVDASGRELARMGNLSRKPSSAAKASSYAKASADTTADKQEGVKFMDSAIHNCGWERGKAAAGLARAV